VIEDVARALLVMAHPDDVDFAAGGTVALWTDAGVEVTYLIVTDGDAGGFDDDVPREEIAPIRRAEQLAAAKCVGVTDVRFLGYPDGRVEATLDLRRDIARVIRQVRPDRVLIPSPERNYERLAPSHPDHRAVGSAALDAVYPDARNPYAFPELRADGLEAWIVREVWISAGGAGAHYVDVTEVFDRKLAALRSHVSQIPDTADFEETLRGYLGASAQRGGLGEGRLAEVFTIVSSQ
jgi:LmbE family N-acetylglucosaminyl deacetylase